jgi:NitT/TauT family transport system ATP-binding protein
MTSRPGTIAETIKIDLPHPRTLEIINTPAFGAYAKHIRALLQANGDLS